ncbi:esterase [Sulfurimonas aquatica]|uniref:Esterase n=1 Tax=Sulfurimonas aquatica TaxID=2672570 RepID=A0A975GDR0_9BACT|nr:YqiA/YcfP family alpha/beta fold hydrolase [Sulfurimonas aquatica]QSZ42623.1 esterase [Sulfurimonas aquatica]
MTIYIHGFASSAQGIKAKAFRKYFQEYKLDFIAPSLSYIPELAISTLEEMIESYLPNVTLIGSSLGGYYSIYLANKYGLKATLINPSIHPNITLQKVLGKPTSFYDGSTFEWNEKHIQMLKRYKVNAATEKNFMLLLQKGDETLDYKEAIKKLPNSNIILEENGNHSFENIENHFQKIKEFFLLSS